MTGKISKWACVSSTNQLQFDFPYHGGSTGELCVRKRADGSRDAWVEVDKGQFICHYDNCTVRVKFDDGAIRSFGMAESSSGNSNILFFNSYGTFTSSLKKAKRVKVEAQYYQRGREVLEFDVAGLKWDQ